MERLITQKLIEWKNSRRRKPLLITGVRQCGKTYTIKQFGEQQFDNTVYINFEENERYAGIFAFDFSVERIVKEIEILFRQKIVPGKTLLVFDEIQECPRAITSLKYFCENLRELHVICAGSLLGVALRRENISFPVGKVNRMQMYAMGFYEFVMASGHSELLDVLKDWPVERPIPELYTVPMSRLLKEYYLVGGMPEAVSEWVETHNISHVDEVLDEILHDYADDISKHAPISEIEKIRWIWESVPKQLAKENNKFVFSHVKAGKRSAELEDALQWLTDSGLVNRVELVENIEVPLSDMADATYFKVYMSDIGLLRRRCGLNEMTLSDDQILFIHHKGAMTENYVLNELILLERKAYFWRSGNTAEVDFVYENSGHIVPVEVKSADNVQAKSYRSFCKKYAPEFGLKISMKNIAENLCESTRTVNLPHYLLWNLNFYDGK